MTLQAIKQFRYRELVSALGSKGKVTTLQKTPTIPNPFLPRRNPETGRWAPPKYSLRQQADLVKAAKASGTLHLLPPGPKFGPSEMSKLSQAVSEAPATRSEAWKREVIWEGEVKEKKVTGADIGNRLYAGRKRMFKGHKWERTLEKRTWKTRMLMRGMKGRIQRFKSTYQRRKPRPLSPARTTGKAPKLPF
ncbi:hypothetical protein K474DRAFT_1621397 [Panus rudis PR-1116 ss-1]|nr:hypothetical protein K474DRAFT_1621397 [Panus rudis PR-1116 ss-1]